MSDEKRVKRKLGTAVGLVVEDCRCGRRPRVRGDDVSYRIECECGRCTPRCLKLGDAARIWRAMRGDNESFESQAARVEYREDPDSGNKFLVAYNVANLPGGYPLELFSAAQQLRQQMLAKVGEAGLEDAAERILWGAKQVDLVEGTRAAVLETDDDRDLVARMVALYVDAVVARGEVPDAFDLGISTAVMVEAAPRVRAHFEAEAAAVGG